MQRTTNLHEIVIVNFGFLQRPQERSRGNQLIHRRISKTKPKGSGSDPESQTGRQSEGYGGLCLELRRGGREKIEWNLPQKAISINELKQTVEARSPSGLLT